jgi:hypothetical protein
MTTLHPTRRRIQRAELVVPAIAVLAAVVTPLLVAGRLPDPLAIHWGLDGRPDGSGPLVLDVTVLAVATAVVTLLPLWSAARADGSAARLLVALAHGMAGLFAFLRLRTLQLNLDAADWTAAGALGAGDLLLAAVAVVPLGALGWWLGGRHPAIERERRTVAAVELPSDGRLVWVGTQTWPAGGAVALVLVVAGGLLSAVRIAPEALTAGAALVIAGLLVRLLTSISLAVGPAGLVVRFGPLGWPRVRVPLADVVAVEVEDVEPMAYGGWGYRVMPGVRAVVIRRGVGLRVRRGDRPDLIVTVDGAADAAGVLAAHVAGRGPGRASGPDGEAAADE